LARFFAKRIQVLAAALQIAFPEGHGGTNFYQNLQIIKDFHDKK
jgi:hypothetical protein